MKKDNNFDTQEFDFTQLARKARRRTLIRTSFISLLVSITVLFGLYTISQYQLRVVEEQKKSADRAWTSIEGANIHESGGTTSYGLFSYTVTNKFEKILNDRPVPWKSVTKSYDIWGKEKTVPVGVIVGYGSLNNGRMQKYLEGKRVLDFYHPYYNYDSFTNDLLLLNEISEDKIVEIGISFSNPLTITEVKKTFNDKHLAWLWVNTDTKEEIKSKKGETFEGFDYVVSGEQALGFEKGNAGHFIHTLDFLSKEKYYKNQINTMINNITEGNPKDLSVERLKINGVVLTGTPNELKSYIGNPVIRASTLGVVIDKY